MRTIAALSLLLVGCDQPSKASQATSSITVELPPVMEAKAPDEAPPLAIAVSPQEQQCLGTWAVRYSQSREDEPSFTLVIARTGHFFLNAEGAEDAMGRWTARGGKVHIQDGVLYDCGLTIAHMTRAGKEYSLRRHP